MIFNNKKSAFTLSEVMLTISLIGILATLTLTTIGTSIQERARVAEFRTAYAKMTSVLKSIMADDGKLYQCYLPPGDEKEQMGLRIADGTSESNNDDDCTQLANRFMRAMGVTRTCKGDAVSGGCIPNNYPTAGDCAYFNSYDNVGAYVLSNSMIILTDSQDNLKIFAVDINGRKGPNKWGQDIFPFSLKASESINVGGRIYVKDVEILPPDESCTYASGAGKTTTSLMSEAFSRKEPEKPKTEEKTE